MYTEEQTKHLDELHKGLNEVCIENGFAEKVIELKDATYVLLVLQNYVDKFNGKYSQSEEEKYFAQVSPRYKEEIVEIRVKLRHGTTKLREKDFTIDVKK